MSSVISTAQPLTLAETPVCQNIRQCLDILERHGVESFDYNVLRTEFSRFGTSGQKQLFKAMAGNNTDLSKHATELLSHSDFEFSVDEANVIANQWPHGDVQALAALMLKQYSPPIRQAAISTLTNTDENIRFWSREILKFGEMNRNMSHTQIQAFEPAPAAFEILKAAALTAPTPDITNFIAQYPVEKSQPILKVLLSSESSSVVHAALKGLYAADKQTSFQSLRESVARLDSHEGEIALAIAAAVRTQFQETQDSEFITFASRMLTDQSANDIEALVGADILMGLEQGPKLPDTDIAMKGVERALAAHGTVPLFYINGLKQKFGTHLANGLNLFWAALSEPVTPNKSKFVKELSTLPANETVLKILQSALEDKADWRVLVEAANIASVEKISDFTPALEEVADNHPVLMARAAALAALDSLSNNNKIDFSKTRLEWEKKIQNEVKDCDLNPRDFKSDSTQLPYFSSTAIAYNNQSNRAYLSTAVSTGSGWLAGYNIGEFSGGLVYYGNQTGAGELIYGQANLDDSFTEYYVPNIVGVLPKIHQNLGHYGQDYWAFSGLNHRGSQGAILSVSVRPDGIQVERHFQLPKAPQAIERLADNSLLIGFGEKPKGKDASEYRLSHYHPPLRLMSDGTVVSGCSDLSDLQTQATP